MSKRIVLTVVLMTLCVLGITALQFYWNYKNYVATMAAFRHQANKSLNEAVDAEMEQRHEKMVDSFKRWMSDTSVVKITCENNNRKRSTVFHMKDAHPLNDKEKGVALGIRKFTKSLSQITPEAKQVFIDHFSENILKPDLKKGIVYNYTQQLGERLLRLHDHNKMDTTSLKRFFRTALSSYGISPVFSLNPIRNDPKLSYRTNAVNTALNRPFEKEMVWAGIQSPNTYFFSEMKWVATGSLLLISITIFCFFYTVKTLLSQHQLTVLRNSFVNNMTHEFNTPIASILVTVQSLKTFEHERALQLEFLGIIEDQGQKLKAQASQILDINSLGKKSGADFQPVDLNILVQKAILDMEVQRAARLADVVYLPYKNPLFINGNPLHLLHVFTNVIDNALKYARHKPEINIHLSTKSGMAILKFSDKGIGIPLMYHKKIFDEFFRVPNGNLHDVKGYGLGLSYVAQVVKNHHGKIRVSENSPNGTMFTFKFPMV